MLTKVLACAIMIMWLVAEESEGAVTTWCSATTRSTMAACRTMPANMGPGRKSSRTPRRSPLTVYAETLCAWPHPTPHFRSSSCSSAFNKNWLIEYNKVYNSWGEGIDCIQVHLHRPGAIITLKEKRLTDGLRVSFLRCPAVWLGTTWSTTPTLSTSVRTAGRCVTDTDARTDVIFNNGSTRHGQRERGGGRQQLHLLEEHQLLPHHDLHLAGDRHPGRSRNLAGTTALECLRSLWSLMSDVILFLAFDQAVPQPTFNVTIKNNLLVGTNGISNFYGGTVHPPLMDCVCACACV